MISKESSLLVKSLFLLIAFLFYSCEGIFGKIASQYPFLGLRYIFFFSCVIISLGIFAILWQKVLEIVPLSKAFLCKSITIVFILAVSHFAFDESITLNNIVGIFFIIGGITLLAWKK